MPVPSHDEAAEWLKNALAALEEDNPGEARRLRQTALDFAIKYASRKGRSNVTHCVLCADAFYSFLVDGSTAAPSVGV